MKKLVIFIVFMTLAFVPCAASTEPRVFSGGGGAGGADSITMNDDVQLIFGTGGDAAIEFDNTANTTYFFYKKDWASDAVFTFTQSDAAYEMTEDNAEQPFVSLKPEVLHTGTASYIGILLDVTESSTGSGTNELMALRVGGVDKFTVSSSNGRLTVASGGIYSSGGSLLMNTIRGSGNNVTQNYQTVDFTAPDIAILAATGTHTIVDADGAGDSVAISITPTFNIEDDGDDNHQYKALIILATETSVDADTTDYLIYAGTDTDPDAFNVDNVGNTIIAGTTHSVGAITSDAGCCVDYVFEEGYKLPTITEMESFIKENGHLPGMTQMVGGEKGETRKVNLTEALRENTEKVEEMSLYIIQLHKRVQAYENAIGNIGA